MVRENPDPYLVLGVSPTAQGRDHRLPHRLRAHHPDTRHPPASQNRRRRPQVLAAYALLRDPARRADYDRATAHAATTTTPPPTRADTC